MSKIDKHVIFIDLPIRFGDLAFGLISGSIRLPLVPAVGDSILFNFSGLDLSLREDDVFMGICRVQSRLISVDEGLENAIFYMDALTFMNKENAREVIRLFESQYALIGEEYDL